MMRKNVQNRLTRLFDELTMSSCIRIRDSFIVQLETKGAKRFQKIWSVS